MQEKRGWISYRLIWFDTLEIDIKCLIWYNRIVSLDEPFLTDEAKEVINLLINESLDQEGRSYKNAMKLMVEDGINNLLPKSDDAFVNFLNPFLRLTRKEKNKRIIKIKNYE